MDQHQDIVSTITKVLALGLAWFGSVKLGDVQTLVAIISGLAVGAYAVLQFISLWRREFRDKK